MSLKAPHSLLSHCLQSQAMKLGSQVGCIDSDSFRIRLAFLQSSGFFRYLRITQIIQILVIQRLYCKALTHVLMIVF